MTKKKEEKTKWTQSGVEQEDIHLEENSKELLQHIYYPHGRPYDNNFDNNQRIQSTSTENTKGTNVHIYNTTTPLPPPPILVNTPEIRAYASKNLNPSMLEEQTVNEYRVGSNPVGPHDFEEDPFAPPDYDDLPPPPVIERSVSNFASLFEGMIGVDIKESTDTEVKAEIDGDNGAVTFVIPYKILKGIKKLTLIAPRNNKSYQQIQLNGWKQLAEACFNDLEELHLHFHQIDLAIANVITSHLVKHSPDLKTLDMFENRIDGTTATFIVQNLLEMKKLENVNLGENILDGPSRRSIDQLTEKAPFSIDLF